MMSDVLCVSEIERKGYNHLMYVHVLLYFVWLVLPGEKRDVPFKLFKSKNYKQKVDSL